MFSDRIPNSHEKIIRAMFSLGYGTYDLLKMDSFDPKNFTNINSTSDNIYLIANGKLYYINQVKKTYEMIEIDAQKLQNIIKQFFPNDKTNHTLTYEQLQTVALEINHDAYFQTWGGICHGISSMAMYAHLLGENDIAHFSQRFKLISLMISHYDLISKERASSLFSKRFEEAKKNILNDKNKYKDDKKDQKQEVYTSTTLFSKLSLVDSFTQLESEMKTPDEKLSLDKEILELRNFFDSVLVHQNINKMPYLFEEKSLWQKVRPAMSIVAPVELTTAHPVEIDKFSCIYSETELTKLLDHMRKCITFDFSMIIQSNDHAINVSYHPNRRNPWILVDANNLPPIEFKDEKELAKNIITALLIDEDICAFSANLFTAKDKAAQAKTAMDVMKNTVEWKRLHEINKLRAQLVDARSNTWLHSAIQAEDKNTVTSLLSSEANYAAVIAQTQVTPYSIAITRDESIASLIFNKLSNEVLAFKSNENSERAKIFAHLKTSFQHIEKYEKLLQRIQQKLDEKRKSLDKEQFTLGNLEKIRAENKLPSNEMKIVHSKVSGLNGDILEWKNLHEEAVNATQLLRNKWSATICALKDLDLFVQSFFEKAKENKLDQSKAEMLMEEVYRLFPNRNKIIEKFAEIFDCHSFIINNKKHSFHKEYITQVANNIKKKEKQLSEMLKKLQLLEAQKKELEEKLYKNNATLENDEKKPDEKASKPDEKVAISKTIFLKNSLDAQQLQNFEKEDVIKKLNAAIASYKLLNKNDKNETAVTLQNWHRKCLSGELSRQTILIEINQYIKLRSASNLYTWFRPFKESKQILDLLVSELGKTPDAKLSSAPKS